MTLSCSSKLLFSWINGLGDNMTVNNTKIVSSVHLIGIIFKYIFFQTLIIICMINYPLFNAHFRYNKKDIFIHAYNQ